RADRVIGRRKYRRKRHGHGHCPASRQAVLPFRSLDPFRALREPDRRRRDEERPSRSEQRTATNQNDHLTGKAPYKFESSFLQRRVCELSVPRRGHARITRSSIANEKRLENGPTLRRFFLNIDLHLAKGAGWQDIRVLE